VNQPEIEKKTEIEGY